MDRRIGRNFLNAGIGYGGSCFPKDIAAFITISEQLGVPFDLLKEVQRINAGQKERFLKVDPRSALGLARQKDRRLGTDLQAGHGRHSIVGRDRTGGGDAARKGAQCRAYDPKGMEKAREVEAIAGARLTNSRDGGGRRTPRPWSSRPNGRSLRTSISPLVKEKMHTPMVFDGRNLFDPETMAKLGFHYHSIGRARLAPPNRANENASPMDLPAGSLLGLSRALAGRAGIRGSDHRRSCSAGASLGPPDRAFALELFYGVLRNLSSARFLDRKIAS